MADFPERQVGSFRLAFEWTGPCLFNSYGPHVRIAYGNDPIIADPQCASIVEAMKRMHGTAETVITRSRSVGNGRRRSTHSMLRPYCSWDMDLRERAEARYVIGPINKRTFYDGSEVHNTDHRGPWSKALDFIRSSVQIAHNRLMDETWRLDHHKFLGPGIVNDPSELCIHTCQKLLERVDAIVPYMTPKDPEMTKATLWHSDLHHNNIVHKDGQISAMVDWQGVWACPLYLTAKDLNPIQLPPDFGELKL